MCVYLFLGGRFLKTLQRREDGAGVVDRVLDSAIKTPVAGGRRQMLSAILKRVHRIEERNTCVRVG